MLQLTVLKKNSHVCVVGLLLFKFTTKEGSYQKPFSRKFKKRRLNFKMKMFIKSILFATLFDVNINFLYTRNK